MPAVCAVADCTNVFMRGSAISLHRFPKEIHVRKAWIVKCKRQDNFNPSTSLICSEHFTADDYERDLMNELMQLPPRKKLKTGSIPSVFRHRQKDVNNATSTSRIDRHQKRSNAKIATLLIVNNPDENEIPPDLTPNKIDFSCHVDFPDSRLVEVNKRLRMKISDLKATIKHLRSKLCVHRNKGKLPKFTNRTFTKSQLKKLHGQARVNWETADVVNALSLRSVSLKAYETARTSWKLPLPAPSTLRRWIHRFQCVPGIQTDIIRILGEHSSSFGNLSKICALCFDEMGLDGRFVLDNVQDQITSHSKVQVIMARGIIENWKQPIYFNFDSPMTVNTLTSTIVELEKANIHVVSVTSDLGGENRGLWKHLNISPEQPWFRNPFDQDRKIFVFADMPHLLKLIRNHILDDGLMTEDGAVINRDVMQSLVDFNYSELNLCPKLTQSLIEVSGVERMRVRAAAHLFSRHSAMLAKSVYSDTLEIGNFIQLINDGFDIFNSRCHVNSSNPLLSALGVNITQQLNVLQQLKHVMKTSRFFLKDNSENVDPRLKSALLPCQVGYLVSIEALVQLFEFLKDRYGIEYLITCRLLQDCLESFFSRIRGFGGPNTNPTPAEFRYRFRLILLGGFVRPPRDGNSLMHCSSSYVSADLINKNCINVVVNPPTNKLEPRSLNISDEIRKKVATSTPTDEIDYLAGYIAWRLKRKYPTLPQYGTPTNKIVNISQPTWIEMLSRGGLLTPNHDLKTDIIKCNSVFESAMKQLQERPKLSDNLQQCISYEFPEIRKEIVAEFLKVRIKIRLNRLNINRQQSITAKKMKSVLQSKKFHPSV